MNAEIWILELAVDDYIGLWEILWRARALDESAADEELFSRALSGVDALLENELLIVSEGTVFSGEQRELSQREGLSAVRDWKHWTPPERGANHLRVAATEKGRRAYEGTSAE